jgi:cytochrome c oxidase cbb3-type subunit IV
MDMFDLNINHLRAAVTLLSFVAFASIVFWAWSKRNRAQFDEAAMLPFVAEPDANAMPTSDTTPAAHPKEV